jgi:hypothetical protein
MERKRAMAVAATVTCVLGSSAVALAATTGLPVLGFGRSRAADAAEVSTVWSASTAQQARRVVTRTKNVFDEVVVDVPEGGAASATPPTAPAAVLVPGPAPTTGDVPRTPVTTSPPHRRPRTGEGEAPPTTVRTTVPRSHGPPPTATTVPPTTTTSRPPGVPDDWPPDKPIPPMPPNCRQPQLEDNGVWNCQDDD